MEKVDEVPMILVCGFKPFQNEKINPTEKLIEELELIKKSSEEFQEFQTLVLPVSYQQAPEVLKEKILQLKPKKVLMMGQAGSSTRIRLERVALNWQETDKADESGYQPSPGKIDPQSVDAYFTTMKVEQLKAKLESQQIPVEISFSAGAFVCNRVYYEFYQVCGNQVPGLFVHFPFLSSQVMGNQNKASLSWEVQKQAFLEILRFF